MAMTLLGTRLPHGAVTRCSKFALAGLLALLCASACSKAESDAPAGGTLGPSTSAEQDDSDTDEASETADEDSEDSDTADSGESQGPDSTSGSPMLDLGMQLPSCDPWLQDCPPGDKCSWQTVGGEHEAICVPEADQPKLAGEPCTAQGEPGSGYDDCALGLLCTWLDEQGQGLCQPLCTGSPEQPSCPESEPASVCQLCPGCPSLCAASCHPLAEVCPPGFACKPGAGTFLCTPEQNLGTGALGDPCEYSVQCQADFACIDGALLPGCEGAGCCSPLCDADAPECPEQLSCVLWAGEVPPGPTLGVCMAP